MNLSVWKWRISKFFSVISAYWKQSKYICGHEGAKSRWHVLYDMVVCTFRYGASDTNYLMYHYYGQSHAYRDSFITWRRTSWLSKHCIDDGARSVLENKAEFNRLFPDVLHRDWLDCQYSTREEIKAFVEKYGVVICKPIGAALGIGVHQMAVMDVDIDLKINKINGGGGYILEELVENEATIKAFNPGSLNTIRIITFTDKLGHAEVVTAILRMGMGNGITDNLCNGGIACVVDVETGALSRYARTEKDLQYKEHPVSKVKFEGFVVPHFEEAKHMVLDLCGRMPKAQYVGWDVAVTTRGVCVIEGNIPPSEETTEFAGVGHWAKLKRVLNVDD